MKCNKNKSVVCPGQIQLRMLKVRSIIMQGSRKVGYDYLFSREMLRFDMFVKESRMAEYFAANVATRFDFVNFQMVSK